MTPQQLARFEEWYKQDGDSPANGSYRAQCEAFAAGYTACLRDSEGVVAELQAQLVVYDKIIEAIDPKKVRAK